jgi:hypothetical protein
MRDSLRLKRSYRVFFDTLLSSPSDRRIVQILAQEFFNRHFPNEVKGSQDAYPTLFKNEVKGSQDAYPTPIFGDV